MRALILVVWTWLMLMLCFGCAAPAEKYVEGDVQTYKAVADEYLKYVEQDRKLDDDQKFSRRLMIATWRLRIRAAGREDVK